MKRLALLALLASSSIASAAPQLMATDGSTLIANQLTSPSVSGSMTIDKNAAPIESLDDFGKAYFGDCASGSDRQANAYGYTDGAVSMCPQDYFFLKWAIHDVNTIQEYWNTTTLTMDVVEKNNGKLLKRTSPSAGTILFPLLQTTTPATGDNSTLVPTTTWANSAIANAAFSASQTFTSSGTWTKKTGAQTVSVFVIGVGGNGGPGATIASSASGSGGGGGGGAEFVWETFPAALIPSTVTVTVAPVSAPVSSGVGVTHAATSFGSYAIAQPGADGGPASSGAAAYGGNGASPNVASGPSTTTGPGASGYFTPLGGTGNGAGGVVSSQLTLGSSGGGSTATGGSGAGGNDFGGVTGGGGGGGLNGGTAQAGGAAGIVGTLFAAGGTASGGAGSRNVSTWPVGTMAQGGGGGGGNGSGVGGAGAAAGGYGAGGGGGGSGTGGGGLGGQGGAAIVIVDQH